MADDYRIALRDWTPPLRVKGHTLRHEGRAHTKPGCDGACRDKPSWRIAPYVGHALCSCGEYGPCDDTDAARKRWHREHKAEVSAPVLSGQPEADQ